MLEELAQREKDTARALYIQLVAGKVDGYSFELIKDLRGILDDIEKKLSYTQLGYKSDLKGLAKRESYV